MPYPFQIVQDDPLLAQKLGLNTVAPAEPGGSTPQMLEQGPTRIEPLPGEPPESDPDPV